jgi:hypothetical protein
VRFEFVGVPEVQRRVADTNQDLRRVQSYRAERC